MLKVVLEASCGQRKAHSLRVALQPRRLYGTVLQPEMPGKASFVVCGPKIVDKNSNARLGDFAVEGRNIIQTPNFFAITSRGVVPHITPDVLSQHTGIGGVHIALEDCKFEALWFK